MTHSNPLRFCILTGLFVAWAAFLPAQITIDNSIFPEMGDTLFYSTDQQPAGIAVSPAGPNQTWNYSQLTGSISWQQLYKDPVESGRTPAFPNANLFYRTTAALEGYLEISNTAVKLLGVFGADPFGFGFDLASKFDPPQILLQVPMDYEDRDETENVLLFPVSVNDLPDTLVNQFPIRPDSVRLKTTISRNGLVDAWGSLTIPGGEYEVLRREETTLIVNRLEAKVPIFGWQDVTDFALALLNPSTPIPLEDTLMSYTYWSNTSKESIATLFVDPLSMNVSTVQFKDEARVTTSVDDAAQRQSPSAKIYPNPAREEATLELKAFQAGSYHLVLYDVLGVESFRTKLDISSGLQVATIDLSQLTPGPYFYSLQNRQRLNVAEGSLVIQ